MRFSNRQLTAFTAALALAGSLTGVAVAQAASPTPPGARPLFTPSASAVAKATDNGSDPSGIGLVKGAGQGVVNSAAEFAAARKSALWASTPSGEVYYSCNYSIPNHANVNSVTGVITLPGGLAETMNQCDYPRIVDNSIPTANTLPADAPSNPAASTSGWFQGFGNNSNNPPLTLYYSKLAVPEAPSNHGSNLSLFEWGGLGSHNTSTGVETSLLQPVVGWRRSAREGRSAPGCPARATSCGVRPITSGRATRWRLTPRR